MAKMSLFGYLLGEGSHLVVLSHESGVIISPLVLWMNRYATEYASIYFSEPFMLARWGSYLVLECGLYKGNI